MKIMKKQIFKIITTEQLIMEIKKKRKKIEKKKVI